MSERRQSVNDGFEFDAATVTGAFAPDGGIALATEAPADSHARAPIPALAPPPAFTAPTTPPTGPVHASGDYKSSPAAAPLLAPQTPDLKAAAPLPRGAALSATAAAAAGGAQHLRHDSHTPSAKGGLVSAGAFRQRKALGEPVVEIRNLKKSFTLEGRSDVVQALRDVNLTADSECQSIRRGEFVMIRGPSGGGKTTLLNIIGTIDEPTAGSISVFGSVVDAKSTDAYLANLRLNKIGFVFQTFNLLATLSAYENVLLPMTISGRRSAKDARTRAIQLLTLVGLADRMAHLPSELSGGEQQRVTIARALANEPELLLLDEPTGDLDTRNTVDVMDLILSINVEKQCTCLMVTHNPDLECYADRILYVQDGAFKKQALNECQSRLDYDLYMQHLTTQTATTAAPAANGRADAKAH